MIPKLKDILDILEKIAPARLAEPWDNPGLQVGSYSHEISKILVALDPTLRALKSAQERNAQLLLTHHPLIFDRLSRLDILTYPGNVIIEAVKNSISLVAAHTNLDVSRGGINDILADILGLQHVEILKHVSETDGAGLGRIGDLPEPAELSVVVKRIKEILDVDRIKVVGRQGIRINRVAVVGGSGGNMVSLAAQKGADLLLTGDVSHHHALKAESLDIALIDGGHFHTEKVAFGIFAGHLKDMFTSNGWKVAVEIFEDETDPVRDA